MNFVRDILAAALSAKQAAVIALVVVVTTLLLISSRRRMRQTGTPPLRSVRDHLAGTPREHDVRDDIREVMLQLEQLAREINARVDNSFTKLERLLEDADDHGERLERLLDRAAAATHVDVTTGVDVTLGDDAGAAPAPAGAPPSPEGVRSAVFRLADAGQSPHAIARELGRPIGEVELMLALRKAAV